MNRDAPRLVERIVNALERAGRPRSSAELAREFLGVGILDEPVAGRLLDPVLGADPRLEKTARGWTVREAATSYEARPAGGLGDDFAALFAPARVPVAGFWQDLQAPQDPIVPPAWRRSVCLAGEAEAIRFEQRTGRSVVRPVIALASVARRLRGYRGPADAVAIAERLGAPHLEAEGPDAAARTVGSAWLMLSAELQLEGVCDEADLERMMNERLEAVAFEGKRFGPESIDQLPETPGVYVFRDEDGEPLYIGQSAQLRARVGSYFAGPPRDEKDRLIRQQAFSLEVREADSAIDALLIENRSIRREKPRLNVRRQVRDRGSATGVLSVPGTAGRVLFTLVDGVLVRRVRLLAGPRRGPRAAARAVEPLEATTVRSVSFAAAESGALVEFWRRLHPLDPFVEPGRHGGQAQMIARLLAFANES